MVIIIPSGILYNKHTATCITNALNSFFYSDVLLTTNVGVTLNVAFSETFAPSVPTTYIAPSGLRPEP